MSKTKLNKFTLHVSNVIEKSVIKATSAVGIFALTIGIVAGSHAAIASIARPTERAVTPSNTLQAQMSGGSMGNQMGRSKMKNMKRSKMRNRMSRSKMGNNMGGNMRTGKK